MRGSAIKARNIAKGFWERHSLDDDMEDIDQSSVYAAVYELLMDFNESMSDEEIKEKIIKNRERQFWKGEMEYQQSMLEDDFWEDTDPEKLPSGDDL